MADLTPRPPWPDRIVCARCALYTSAEDARLEDGAPVCLRCQEEQDARHAADTEADRERDRAALQDTSAQEYERNAADEDRRALGELGRWWP